jgi:hypothetical protein
VGLFAVSKKMKTRTAGVVIGILAVVCIGLILSVVYPFTTSRPHAANPSDTQFAVGTANAYSTAGSIVVDGEVQLAFEGVVTSDGAWYQKVVEENVTSEAYQPTANGTVYERQTIVGRDRAERLREEIVEDEDSVLVRTERNGNQVTFVVERNTTGVTEPVSGTASVFVNSLSVAGYETEETDSAAVTLYEPQPGWYNGSETYRITGVTGTVRADADTHVVKSANVSWDVTTPARTYAEYLLVRSVSDEPTAYEITFEFNPDDHDLERPVWVNETDSEVNVQNTLAERSE